MRRYECPIVKLDLKHVQQNRRINEGAMLHLTISKPVLLVVLLGRWLVPGVPAQETDLEPISVLTLVGRPLPVVAGEMHGTFTRYGIAVKTQNFANSALMRKALADGSGDLAYAAADNAVAMGRTLRRQRRNRLGRRRLAERTHRAVQH